jgi:hypothetical protein
MGDLMEDGALVCGVLIARELHSTRRIGCARGAKPSPVSIRFRFTLATIVGSPERAANRSPASWIQRCNLVQGR